MQAVFLSVQNINRKVEISGKGYPQKIGDLQICRKRADSLEKNYHCNDNGKQQQNPYKRKQVSLHIEENQAPYEVHRKVDSVSNQRRAHGIVLCILELINKGGAYSHKGEKYCPHNRE